MCLGRLDRMVVLQLPVKSMPITINALSLNPAHGKVHLIQIYVIKFVSDLHQVGAFLWDIMVHPPIKPTAMI